MSTATKRRVVVTGAAGVIAGQVLPALQERYALVLLDIRPADCDGVPVDGIRIADLTNTDRDAYRHHFQGADAVVHLGLARGATQQPDDQFRAELTNVQMAYNIYQTSLEAGVRRVVIASSNHAADYYEPLILDGQREQVDPDDRPLSDRYYGWAKEAQEHLGFVFAVGRQSGKPLENVQLRIGGPSETSVARCPLGDMRCVRRALAVYISARDLQQLVVKSIETVDIRDRQGVPFQIFYGISNNDRAFWSTASARRVIGYAPQDNSELRFADLVAQHMAAHRTKRQ